MSDEPKTGRLEIRVPDSLIEAIEAWRLRQTVPPSRSAAIRYLIETGLQKAQVGPSSGGDPGPTSRGKLGARRVPRKSAPERKAEPAAPISKEAQIRALREQGVG